MDRSDRAGPAALGACVLAFCAAMGLSAELNIWIGTGAAALVSLFVLWVGARSSVSFGLRRSTVASVAAGTLVGIAMSVATWCLYPLSITVFPPLQGEVETLYALLRQPPGPIRAFPLLLLVVLAEELVWRGLAIDLFSKRFGPLRAVLISALLYVLPQVALGSPLLMIVALLCGLLWGTLRVRFGCLAAPFIAHLVWDLLVFVLYPVI
ncbi:MAG: CPBP family intramembrane metalloprotease [Myxococcales bacterium]|nr:CPBP family intramembrane metalloprotease [Myxococcales bacterium]